MSMYSQAELKESMIKYYIQNHYDLEQFKLKWYPFYGIEDIKL